MRPIPCVILLTLAVLAAWPDLAKAEARHFQVSQVHFEELGTKAAVLSRSVASMGERNILNFYVASAVLYANRAHTLSQLASIVEALPPGAEAEMVRQKMLQTRQYVTLNLTNDIHELDSLANIAETPQVKNLGQRLTNELRVFQRNAETIQ